MRQLGYRVVDFLLEQEGPPLRRASPEEMQLRLDGPPPARAQPFNEVLERLARDVLPFRSRVDHPRFLGFIPGSGTWPGALADLIASASNVYAGSWMESAGPSQVELEVLGWFKDWVGFPVEAAGSLTSGGSAANMTALACAREAKAGAMRDDLVLYVSDQAHSSIARAARILGFRPEQVRVLPTGADLRLAASTLDAAIETDLRAGRTPLLVSANAGATNAGVVDPLRELADVCRSRGVWLHVDGAYGGFAVLSERGRGELRGLELADSLTLDPHKWLYQPNECGRLLVRGRRRRRRFEGADDAEYERRNASLAAALEASGTGLVSSTRLHGRFALRLCILNHTTSLADVDAVLDFLEREEAPDTAAAPAYERNPDVTESLFPAPVPLFASLSAEEAGQVAALATERETQPGETVVEQWGSERDFFVIVDGTADVFLEDEHVRSLGPGEFFGELAALDWGAGYGYSRLATIVAGAPLRLLVFPEGTLAELLRFPDVERQIRAAVQERLARS